MNSVQRTIQIYLPEGDPRGIRIGELTTSIVRLIEVPRALVHKFQTLPESKQVGLYFLVNDDDDQDKPGVYIGQTGDLGGAAPSDREGRWVRPPRQSERLGGTEACLFSKYTELAALEQARDL